MCPMMLDSMPFLNWKRRGVTCRYVLRMRVVHHEEIAGADVVHRDQIFNGFRKSLDLLNVRRAKDSRPTTSP